MRGLQRNLSESVAAITVLGVAAGCAWALMSLPRPLQVTRPPPLVLARDAVAEVLARDHRAAQALSSGPQVVQLEAWWREKVEAEAASAQPVARYRAHKARLRRGVEALRRAQGEVAVLGLRARAIGRMEAALRGELGADEAQAFLGAFPEMLARYAAAKGHALLAPSFVVRTLYAARWNLAHDLAVTYRLAPVELRAYHGWLALHAPEAPLALRQRAAAAYAEVDGRWASLARGALALAGGRRDRAAAHLKEAHARLASWKLRNYALNVVRVQD